MNGSAVGIDIGGSFIKSGLVSPAGLILYETKAEETPPEGNGVVEVVRRVIDEMIDKAPALDLSPIQAIGISSCGVVDSVQETVLESVAISNYNGTAWAKQLGDLDYPLAVENDARSAAWAEFQIRKNREITDFIHVTVGTGVGCGIILGGQIFRGSTYSACEIGHVTINSGGPVGACGNVGCLELYLCSRAIVQYILDAIQDGRTSETFRTSGPDLRKIDVRTISEAEQLGDSVAHEAFQEAGRYLGIGLTTLVNLFNPQAISVGGGVIEASHTVLEVARDVVYSRVLLSARRYLVVEKGELGNKAGVVGAALLAFAKAGQVSQAKYGC